MRRPHGTADSFSSTVEDPGPKLMRVVIRLRHFWFVALVTTLLSLPCASSAFADGLVVNSVVPSPAAPASGTSVIWNASVSGAGGTTLYRFWLFDHGTQAWTLLQDYAPSPAVAWTATAGTYHVQVWAKDSASSALLDAWQNSSTITITPGAPARVASLTVSTTATTVASAVTYTAGASGGTGLYEYRFYLYDALRSVWTMLRDYASSPSVTWTPSQPGNYFSQVWVRAAGSSAAWEDWRNSATTTVASSAPAQLTSVSASNTSTTAYTPVVFTAAASGGAGAYEYRFMLYDAGRVVWTLLQDYSTSNSTTWTPSDAGSYWMQVWVRTAGSSAAFEDWRNSSTVTVAPELWTLTGVTASASTVNTGDPVVWTAEVSESGSPLVYRFWLRNITAGTWQVLQDYSPSPTVTFNPHRQGRYSVQVWARRATSSAEFEQWINSSMVVDAIGPPPPDAPPSWTVVRTVAGSHVVTWDPVFDVDGYLVLESTDRATLAGSPSMAGAATVTAPTYTAPGTPGSVPHFYRVFPVTEGVIGFGGPIAASTSVSALALPTPALLSGAAPAGQAAAADVTPALWDLDGDGCLDLIGRRGNCDGTFTAQALDPLGAGLLFAPGRVNRDSRFADFTGDGIVDIFTNVYSRADDTGSQSILLVGQTDGTFRPDAGVAALGIGGFGETVVAADFDNDGDVDLYLPHYFDRNDGGHSWLLVNDGHGVFHDVSVSAGVSSTSPFNPEGAQGLDFNQDGWIDILVATHLYINNGDLTFTDQAALVGIPARFDEGTLLFDADLDGDLDLVHNDGIITRLYRNVNGHFDAGTAVNGTSGINNYGYGLNVCDINGDGYQDILVAQNNATAGTGSPRLLLNGGGSFAMSEMATLPSSYIDLIACADLDRNGLPDVVTRSNLGNDHFQSLVNNGSSTETLTIRVLGANGERNQQGRPIRVRPVSGSNQTILRIVESGSAYMAQNGYDQLIGIPWAGTVEVSVLFGTGWVTTTTPVGGALTFYADGTIATGLN